MDPLNRLEQVAFSCSFQHRASAGINPLGGFAWRRAWEKETEATLNLYQKDMNHPSPRGIYLAACVMYGMFTGRSAVGDKTYRAYPELRDPGTKGALDEQRAAQLQAAAWETLEECGKSLEADVFLP